MNNNTYRLIQILADGRFHSGETLGHALGITRAAVWKMLQSLPEIGIDYEKVSGKGYRIPNGIELLDKSTIESHLTSPVFLQLSQIEVWPSITSTNQYFLEKIAQNHEVLDLSSSTPGISQVCFAEQQTQGRGRRGRIWVSPFARNLYFSLLWDFAEGISKLSGLSLVVGIAVAKTLRTLGLDAVKLKWPNDIVYQQKKLGGILIELQGDAVGPCQVVIGIGLNVATPAELLQTVDQPWSDLQTALNRKISRNVLAAQILNELIECLAEFQQQGFQAFLQHWQQFDGLAGEKVQVKFDKHSVEGVALGVDLSGLLLVKVNDSVCKYSDGQVSIRLDG